VDPTTTKGDLIARGLAAINRLPLGTDGQVLTVATTTALGVVWAGAPGGGSVVSVFGRQGAVIAQAGDYSAAQVTNAVSTAGSYSDPSWITSLSYGKLTGVPAPQVSSVFGRQGAVVAAAGDYTAAQVTNAVSTLGSYADPAWITSLAWGKLTGVPSYVPTTRTVTAGTGLTGGGDLSADRTLSVVADTTNQRVAVYSAGLIAGTRPSLNLIAGSNIGLTVADNAASNRVDITVAALNAQTPWQQDVDAAGYKLSNTGNVLLNAASLLQLGGISASYPALKRNAPDVEARLADDSGQAGMLASMFRTKDPNGAGGLSAQLISDATNAYLQAYNYPSVGWAPMQIRASTIILSAMNAGQQVTIDGNCFVGINTATPMCRLNVVGNINRPTGLLRLDATYAAAGDYVALGWGVPGGIEAVSAIVGRASAGAQMAFDFRLQNGGNTFASSVNVMTMVGSGNVGIGIASPASQMHVLGAGQANLNFSTTGAKGGTLYLQDSGGGVYNGGCVLFGALSGSFAAIKGGLTNGSGNTVGELGFSTRAQTTDTALTLRAHITQAGQFIVGNSAPLGYPALGTTPGGFGVTYDGAWGLFIGGEPSGTSWIQSQRTDSAQAYLLHLQPSGGVVSIGAALNAGPFNVHVGTNQNLCLQSAIDLRLNCANDAGAANCGLEIMATKLVQPCPNVAVGTYDADMRNNSLVVYVTEGNPTTLRFRIKLSTGVMKEFAISV
jgi:hypothetical protein